MKLKFCTSINEAENKVNKGYRLQQVAIIQGALSQDLDKAGFKCNSVSDTATTILPEFGYLARIQIDAIVRQDRNDQPKYSFKLSGMHGENESPLAPDISEVDSITLINKAPEIAKTIIEYLSALKLNESFNEEYLTEAPFIGNMADRIVAKIKNAKNTVGDKIASKKAEKDAKTNAVDLLNEISKRLVSAIASAFNSTEIGKISATQIKPYIEDTTLYIDIVDFVAKINWGIDPSKAESSTLIASSLETPLSKYEVPVDKLSDGLKIILKKLHTLLKIDFSNTLKALNISMEDSEEEIESPNEEEATANEDEEAEPVDQYLSNLKKNLGNLSNILFTEALTESKRPSRTGSYTKYQQALENADTNTLIPLVKYFLYNELGVKDSDINNRLFNSLVTCIKEEGISPIFNNRLGAFLTYCDVQRSLPVPYFFDSIEDMNIDAIVDLNQGDSLIDALDGNLAVIYTKPFWSSSAIEGDLKRLFNLFYDRNISKNSLATIVAKQEKLDENGEETQLKAMLGNNFTNNPDELRKNILTKSPSSFRSLNEINKLVQAAKKDLGTKNYYDDDDDDEKEKQKKQSLTAFNAEQFEKLKDEIANCDDKTLMKNIGSIILKYQKIFDLSDQSKIKAFKKAFLNMVKVQQENAPAAQEGDQPQQ